MNVVYAKIEAQIKYRRNVKSERYIPMSGECFSARVSFAHQHSPLHNKHLSISGYIFGFQNWGGGCLWHIESRSQGCCKHATMHKEAHTTNNYLAQNINTPKLEKPCCNVKNFLKETTYGFTTEKNK